MVEKENIVDTFYFILKTKKNRYCSKKNIVDICVIAIDSKSKIEYSGRRKI